MSKAARLHILVVASYVLLTLVMTYPLAVHFSDAIPGDGFDGWQNYWNLWWVKTALLDLHQSPYFTHYLYHPTGTSLLFQTLNIFNSLWSLPIQLIFGLTISYNSVVLFSFVVGAYGAYLLSLKVTANERGVLHHLVAFVAGVVFAFSPFHFAHLLGHMQVFSLEWLPFYVLCLAGCLSSERLRVVPHVVLPVVFLVLTALCDWYYVLYLLIFTLVYVAYLLWQGRRPRLLLTKTALVAGLTALVLSPLLLPMIVEALRDSTYLSSPFETTVRLSADLVAFVTPNELHPLWGDAATRLSQGFTSSRSERMVFAGYIPLALSAYALWARRRRALFWWVSCAIFVVLALGPYLHVGGRQFPLPLPYLALYRLLPLLSIARSVSRFDVMVMLSLSVLTALGLQAAVRGLSSSGGIFVGAMATVLVCVEFLPAPYPLSKSEVPSFYYGLASDRADYALLELPMNWDRPTHLLYQTVHHKPLVAGYVTRPNPLSLVERVPVLQHFRFLGPDIIAQEASEVADDVFEYLGVRYAILHQYMLPPGSEREANLALVEEIFGDEQPVHEDAQITVYAAGVEPVGRPFIVLGEGWGERRISEGRPVRSLEAEATLVIVARSGGETSLVFSAFTEGATRPLEMLWNGERVGEYEIAPYEREIDTGVLHLEQGSNILQFRDAGREEPVIVFTKLDLDDDR